MVSRGEKDTPLMLFSILMYVQAHAWLHLREVPYNRRERLEQGHPLGRGANGHDNFGTEFVSEYV
jgi:hypothetical protein